MKNKLINLIIILFLSILCLALHTTPARRYPSTEFTLSGVEGLRAGPGTPVRIISLKPNITELLFAIGAGRQVVGVTTWCDRPAEAKRLPKVADYINPNIEKIIATKPDLIVASRENSIRRPIELLRNMGIPLLVLDFKDTSDLFASTLKLARATGHEKEGLKLITTIQDEIDRLKSKNGPSPKALIVVGKRPLVAAGPDTFLSELLTIAGGKNIIDGKTAYPHTNMETIITKNPDVIIDLSMGSEEENPEKVIEYWKGFPLDAVKAGRVYALNISDFRIGPAIAEQAGKLNELLNQ